MTTAELNAAIEAGTMTITRLPAGRPNPRHLVMTRQGGFRSAAKGADPRGTKVMALVTMGKKPTKFVKLK